MKNEKKNESSVNDASKKSDQQHDFLKGDVVKDRPERTDGESVMANDDPKNIPGRNKPVERQDRVRQDGKKSGTHD